MSMCECGCGDLLIPADKNHTARGYVKGQTRRFIKGHEKRWSGKGRFVNNRGYVMIRLPVEDQYAVMGKVKRCDVSVYVPEHRIVMAQHLGRPLTDIETVHHKNGVRHDNRLENLELWTSRHPKGQRVEDLIKWAGEILQTYSPILKGN